MSETKTRCQEKDRQNANKNAAIRARSCSGWRNTVKFCGFPSDVKCPLVKIQRLRFHLGSTEFFEDASPVWGKELFDQKWQKSTRILVVLEKLNRKKFRYVETLASEKQRWIRFTNLAYVKLYILELPREERLCFHLLVYNNKVHSRRLYSFCGKHSEKIEAFIAVAWCFVPLFIAIRFNSIRISWQFLVWISISRQSSFLIRWILLGRFRSSLILCIILSFLLKYYT